MAVTVTIEFTDAQWELIEEHYEKRKVEISTDTRKLVADDKSAELAAHLKALVRRSVLKNMGKATIASQDNAFDV